MPPRVLLDFHWCPRVPYCDATHVMLDTVRTFLETDTAVKVQCYCHEGFAGLRTGSRSSALSSLSSATIPDVSTSAYHIGHSWLAANQGSSGSLSRNTFRSLDKNEALQRQRQRQKQRLHCQQTNSICGGWQRHGWGTTNSGIRKIKNGWRPLVSPSVGRVPAAISLYVVLYGLYWAFQS
jgi:hypothetical protein